MKKFRYKPLDEQFKIQDEDFKTPAHDDLWLKCQEPKTLCKILEFAEAQVWTRMHCTCLGYCQYDPPISYIDQPKCSWSWDEYRCDCKNSEQRTKIVREIKSIKQMQIEDSILNHIIKGKIRTEDPIIAGNGFVVGFADIFVDLSEKWLKSPEGMFELFVNPEAFLIEIKPKITSIGETIRQLSLYRHYRQKATPIVVTIGNSIPAEPFKSQGIFLYQFQDGKA